MGLYVQRFTILEKNLQQKRAIRGIGIIWVYERISFVIRLIKPNMKAKCKHQTRLCASNTKNNALDHANVGNDPT